MVKALRTITGLLLTAFLLNAATWAVRDCRVGGLPGDNCLWLWLRERLGLPQSKVLRSSALELVGLALLAGLFLTARYVFPPLRNRKPQIAGHREKARGQFGCRACTPSQKGRENPASGQVWDF